MAVRVFGAELTKIAAKVPFIHGTSGPWPVLAPGVGGTILKSDPNARAVYTAMKSRGKIRGIEQFAREAVDRRGGTPVIAHGKMDTNKGWSPFNLTVWGKKNIGTADDAHALVQELDSAVEPRRGEIWRTLHQGVGSWRNNENLEATLKPSKYVPVPPAQSISKQVA